MSIQNKPTDSIISIDKKIQQIDIKSQYIDLAASIHLYGQVNVTKLLAEYGVNKEPHLNAQQHVEHSTLQSSTLKIGVDEAGRGPLLGSVNVAAAILPATWSGLIEEQPLKDTPLSILTDSKQLSEKKRDILYPLVQQHAVGFIISEIPAAVIDQVNILQATMLGMRLCTEGLLEAIAEHLATSMMTFEVLFDGNRCPQINNTRLVELGIKPSAIDCQAWVKGDARHTSIAGASILAKVSRDTTMYTLDAQYPEYGIAKHKGYPTKAHIEAIEKYGVLSDHRRSFAPVRKALES